MLTTQASPPWGSSRGGGNRRPVCGREETGGLGTTDVSDLVREQCVGRQSCEVSFPGVPWPANHAQEEVVLRWACQSDTNTSSADMHVGLRGAGQVTPGVSTGLPPLPLRAEGSLIVDAAGTRVRLQGVNWAGAHINGVPAGLDRVSLPAAARRIRRLGFNLVRLTFSVELVLRNPVPDPILVAANPQLAGLPALEVLAEVATELGRAGVMVQMDDHMLEQGWCCDYQDCNGLWFNGRFSERQWVEALRIVARRSRSLPAVVGVGLRNEPRSVCGGQGWGGQGDFCNATLLMPDTDPEACVELGWASGPEVLQWKRAAERAGRAVLQEHPGLLISVGGLDYCADLTDFGEHPVELPRDRVIYEAHEYKWFQYRRDAGMKYLPSEQDAQGRSLGAAKDKCTELGESCPGVTCSERQDDCILGAAGTQAIPSDEHHIAFSRKYGPGQGTYAESLDKHWGYLLRQGIAPVLVSEFGFSHYLAENLEETAWVQGLAAYMTDDGPLAGAGGLDWAYWEVSGEQEGGTSREAGSTESYGVFNHCWTGPAYSSHYEALQSFMTP